MKKKIAIIFAVNFLLGGLVLLSAFQKMYTIETMPPWMFAPLGICYIPYFILPGMYDVHNWFLTLPCVCMLNATLVSLMWHMILVRKKRNKPTCAGNTVLTRFFWIVCGGVLLLPLFGQLFPSEQMEYQRLRKALIFQDYGEVESIVRRNPHFLKKRVYMLQSEPLVFAVEHPDVKMATILLQAGANPDGVLKKGEPISWAIGYEDTGLLNLLISHGANIEVEGNSALSVASCSLNLNAIKILIAKGAQINSRDSIGRTPIVGAVKSLMVSSSCTPDGTEQLMPVIVYLLQHGADPYQKDDAGKNAIDYARQRAVHLQGTSTGKAFEDIYKLLKSHSLPVSNRSGENESGEKEKEEQSD